MKLSPTLKPDLTQFSLIASLPDDLCLKIQEEINSLNGKAEWKIEWAPRPHLCLVSFVGKDVMTNMIIRWMQRIIQNYTSFDIVLNNYTARPVQSIGLRLYDTSLVASLTTELQVINVFLENEYQPAPLDKNPFIKLADIYDEITFQKTVLHFSQRSFFESFPVSELGLMAKSNLEETPRLVNLFMLKNLPRSLAS